MSTSIIKDPEAWFEKFQNLLSKWEAQGRREQNLQSSKIDSLETRLEEGQTKIIEV